MSYLLDTNACVTHLRQPHSPLSQRLGATPAAHVRLCSVVVAELYYGAHRSAQAAVNVGKVAAFVQQFVSFPFDDAAAEEFARIRTHLEAQGQPIGPYDLQIAAIALVTGVTLVTHNTKEFGRVPGLTIEDWQVP
jgi:tRNA(fMet)-specific endonuclease VapC